MRLQVNISKIICFFVILCVPVFYVVSQPAAAYAGAGKIFKEDSRSIVTVTAYNRKGQELTEGTGFVAGKNGVIVTNFHVISIASTVKVKAGNKVMDVEGVIHADNENDLIILKVNAADLPPVRFGDAGKNRAGDKLYIISSNEGADTIISDGIYKGIKATARKRKALWISAPVSHGSSGSPVFNESDEVIGIVTFLIKRTQHILLAVPSDLITEKIRNNKTITPIDRAIKSYKKRPEHWYYLGYFLIEAGAYKDAIDVFKEAVRLKPGFADAYYYLGDAYEKSGKDSKAAGAYRKAVKAAPDFTDAHFSLGMACGRMGKYREAVEALREAVRLEPDYADARYNLGLACLFLKDKSSALEEYKALKGLHNDLADKLFKVIQKQASQT
ncbi:MAG: tetratricopeptide repeat protein [Nitrospiraceae bacterium]|nr:MAG: tetratricopeptide repeat protein [Nitrospiraceae bacterium]